ncbi:hypothetical protein JST97_25600 [bacterium]|nr:hypothetical protein [bacterium]
MDVYQWFLFALVAIFPGPYLMTRIIILGAAAGHEPAQRANQVGSQMGYTIAALIGCLCLLDWFTTGKFLFQDQSGAWIRVGDGLVYAIMALPVPALLQAIWAASMPVRKSK